MKIAVSGTFCQGKSTYIKDFLNKWTMYKTPDKSYRDVLKEKNLPHSKNATEKTQKIIMDFLVDQIINASKDEYVITDRCVLDVLAFSSWLNLNGKVSDKFLEEQRILTRETLKLYDVIFFTPITKVAKVEIENDGFREVDSVFQEEIDHIFKAFGECYNRNDGRVFPYMDSPAWIEIFGNREERLKMTELYINSDGNPYGDDQSMLNEVIGATEQDLKEIEKKMGK